MSELDRIIAEAVDQQHMPFAVAMVANREGVLWQGSAGRATATLDAGPDTLFRVFSMTKAVGSAAALMLVERGLLSLETPVASVVPEWDELRVLESVGPDGPVLRPPRRTCTLRHLLTHSSGLAYETFHAKQQAYQQLPGSPDILDGTATGFNYPLMFDPGEGFSYGISIDWVGRMVHRIDGRPIDRFCQEEIFDPLGMTDTAFEVDGNRDRLAGIKLRGEDGQLVAIDYEIPSRPEEYGAGHAMYSTAPDYIRFLRMVLNRGELDGRRVLGSQAIELMTTSQLVDLPVPVLKSVLPVVSADVDYFHGAPASWTAAFLRNEGDLTGRRAAGSLTWSGVLNTQYWIDPANDITAVLMTQMMPFCDPAFMRTYEAYEQAVYKTFVDSTRTSPTKSIERNADAVSQAG
jgi:methyl acetate hydrolase